MAKIIKRYMPDGEVRQIWHDAIAPRERRQGAIPGRASRIEVIQEGPQRGKFHVDFSLLADLMDDEQLRICLMQTFDNYADANAAEVAWLTKNWVLEPITAVS